MSISLTTRRTTIALIALAVLLAGAVVAEVVYLVRDDTPSISADRPVVVGSLTQRAAVDAAARATEQMFSTTYQDYESQIDQATSVMTDDFADQYRETAEGIEEPFVAARTTQTVEVVEQGVVQASPSQVQALLFLNQYVEKTQDGQPRTAYSQYRALVTVVHTDHGWLVSDVDTQ